MVRPVMPFLEYMANYDYIAEALCENRDRPYLECNGKCYLEKQLNETSNDSHNHNAPAPKIDLKDYPVSLVQVLDEEISEQEEFLSENHRYSNITLQEFRNTFDKPPALSV